MPRRFVFSRRPGVVTYAHRDPERPDLGIFEDVYDNGPAVELARLMRDFAPKHKDMRHMAVIPADVMEQSYRQGWFHDRNAWKKWANDGSNARFRTHGGRL